MGRMAEFAMGHPNDDAALCALAHREEIERLEREEAALRLARRLSIELLHMIDTYTDTHRSVK